MKVAKLLDSWDRLDARRRWLWGCASGGLGIVPIAALTAALNAWYQVESSEVLFLLPVLLASLFGLGPGLVVAVAAAVVVDYFFLGPVGSLTPQTPDDAVLISAFTALALIVSALVAAISRARWTYQSLVRAAPTPIFSSDPAGRVTAANPAAAALFGRAVDGLIGESLAGLLEANGEQEGRPWRLVQGPAGPVALQEVRAPLPDGAGEVRILQDVTAQAEMLELKEAFLLRVAHELRTPVTAQSALLEALAGNEELGEADRQLAEAALAASRRLGALVEGVLDLGSVRAGTFQVVRAPLALQQVLAEGAATVEPLLRARGQRVALKVPRRSLLVAADRRRLVQVVVNLIGNASRYGPDGETIRLSAERDNSEVRVEVRNPTGTGGQPADTASGLGLGLSISRAIVEAHGGRLGLELGEAESVAWFALPAPRGGRGMTAVLVVEDDPGIAEALRVLLARAGFDVSLAGSGPAGWQSLVRQRPDALLLDLSLPGLSGAELLQRLRAAGEQLPVLAVTADGSSRSLVQVLELGADDYIVKPFRGVEVIARLRAALRRVGGEPSQAEEEPRHLAFGPLAQDPARHEVTVAGRVVDLSPTEFKLVGLFLEQPARMIPSPEIIRRVWGPGAELDRSILKVNMYRLRRKLEATGERWGSIRNAVGTGWGLFEPRPDGDEGRPSQED